MANKVEIVIDAKDNATKVLEGVSGSLKGVAQTAAGVFTGGLALEALGRGVDLLRDSATLAFRVSTEISDGTRQINAALGQQVNVATDYEAVLKGIYSNNFGDNFADIADVVVEVEQNTQRLGGVTQRVLQQMSEDALGVRDVFKIDTGDSIQAAATLMDQFGLTSDQAMDFVVGGLQRGLNASNDFFDSINEYSTQFKQGGADAGEFFSILETGFQGGVLGTDKVADMFKEFRLRIGDGSKATNEALDTLFNGVTKYAGGVEGFLSDLSNGTLEQVDAFDLVIDALGQIDDENQRLALGADLLGTQFEDLGDSVALGVNKSKTGMDELAGSTDLLNVKYDNLGNTIQTLWRRFKVGLDPLGDVINRFLVGQLPLIESVMTRITARMGQVFGALEAGFDAGGLLAGLSTALAELFGNEYTIDAEARIIKATPIEGLDLRFDDGVLTFAEADFGPTFNAKYENGELVFLNYDFGFTSAKYEDGEIVFRSWDFGVFSQDVTYENGQVNFDSWTLGLHTKVTEENGEVTFTFWEWGPFAREVKYEGGQVVFSDFQLSPTFSANMASQLNYMSKDLAAKLNSLASELSVEIPLKIVTPSVAGGGAVNVGGFSVPTLSGGAATTVSLTGQIVDWIFGTEAESVDVTGDVTDLNTGSIPDTSVDVKGEMSGAIDTSGLDDVVIDVKGNTTEVDWADHTNDYDVTATVNEDPNWGSYTHDYNATATIFRQPNWGNYTHIYNATARITGVNWGYYTHAYSAVANITERVTRVVTETTTPRFASGTSFTQAGLAYVHQGEVLVNAPRGGQVITKDAALSALKGGGGGGDIHLHIGNISVGAGGNAFQAGQQLGRGFLSEARALGKI